MEAKQEVLKEEEVSLDEAVKLDALEQKFFKPKANIKYTVTFKSWKLARIEKEKYDFKKKAVVPGVFEKTIVLTLILDSLDGAAVKSDGTPLEMTWEIPSRPCRAAWEPYLRNGQITKMVFEFLKEGEGYDTKYKVVSSGMREAQNTLISHPK